MSKRLAALTLAIGLLSPRAADANVTYGYDALGRVVTALYDNGRCTVFTYDAVGNRTSQTTANPPQSPVPRWGTATWNAVNWSSPFQVPGWGAGGVWGCFNWTP